MARIKKLSPLEAQKIAAGEVVERPSHVVKELIENALDANATRVDIIIEEGGRKRIEVIDNGYGMSPEDAQLCIEQHATSKINSFDDLAHLHTFGFRGEALASIAAVTRLTIITKESVACAGTKIVVEGGIVQEVVPIASPTGTHLIVEDIFYNIPARRKFLRKKETEWNKIVHMVHAFCMSNISIHFTLYSGTHLVLNCPPTSDIIERLTHLWGTPATTHLIPLASTQESSVCTIEGAISDWQYTRYDRSQQFFFVNGRLVKNQHLMSAFNKGYLNVLPAQKYAAGCILITVDEQTIDVNIHPRKEEVHFLNPQQITRMVQEAVTRTLEHHSTQQLSAFVKKEEPFSAAFSSFAPSRPSSPSPLGLLSSFSSGAPTVRTLPLSSFPTDVLHENKPPHQPPTLSLPFSTEPTEIALPTVIGQLLTTYIVAESTQGLVLIDQHAAHERILYERFATATYEPIELLFPPTITLSATDCTVLAEYVELLEQTGIHLTIMGETQIIITAVAAPLKNVDMRECITQIVGIITEHHHLDHEQVTTIIKEKVRAQMACKAAVKAGDILSIEHMNALIVQLHETKNRYTCPHGRPTSWHISQYEIEKKFKRIK